MLFDCRDCASGDVGAVSPALLESASLGSTGACAIPVARLRLA